MNVLLVILETAPIGCEPYYPTFDIFHRTIKETYSEDDYVRLAYSVYAIKTDEHPNEVYRRLWPTFPDRAFLSVVTVSHPLCAPGRNGVEVWLNQNVANAGSRASTDEHQP